MAHFIIVSFPIHGSLHPTLELAMRLARAGARVTYTTSLSAHRSISPEYPTPDGLSYAPFSDGYDDGYPYNFDHQSATSTAKIVDDDAFRAFAAQYSQAGTRKITELFHTCKEEGRPVTCLIYGMLQSWAADLALDLQIPSVALWTQPYTVLAIYYHYFHGYDHLIQSFGKDPRFQVELPGLPLLASKDLPSFLTSPPSARDNFLSGFRDQIKTFDREIHKPRVLVNTFDDLEPDAISSVRELGPIPIGPLIASNLFNGSTSTRSREYMQWLGSKPAASVVYISFGTIVSASMRQREEILKGLLETGRPFLWVIKGSYNGSDYEEFRSRVDGSSEQGQVVGWCSQVEVLGHPSTGCFVTHCGWNSTVESLTTGVPMVCFPQWTEQMTNAKLVEDVWKAGVRVRANEDGIMEGGELKRCLEEVMAAGGGEVKKNAEKWRDSAREAIGEGGSSDGNIRKFVEEMGGVF